MFISDTIIISAYRKKLNPALNVYSMYVHV